MPGWLQAFARNQPLSVTIDAVRSLFEGGPALHWVWQSLVWSVVLFLVFFPVSLALYRKSTA
jgi:ABC-2 type transport system permease protein/oleandomycin transport system permease protein